MKLRKKRYPSPPCPFDLFDRNNYLPSLKDKNTSTNSFSMTTFSNDYCSPSFVRLLYAQNLAINCEVVVEKIPEELLDLASGNAENLTKNGPTSEIACTMRKRRKQTILRKNSTQKSSHPDNKPKIRINNTDKTSYRKSNVCSKKNMNMILTNVQKFGVEEEKKSDAEFFDLFSEDSTQQIAIEKSYFYEENANKDLEIEIHDSVKNFQKHSNIETIQYKILNALSTSEKVDILPICSGGKDIGAPLTMSKIFALKESMCKNLETNFSIKESSEKPLKIPTRPRTSYLTIMCIKNYKQSQENRKIRMVTPMKIQLCKVKKIFFALKNLRSLSLIENMLFRSVYSKKSTSNKISILEIERNQKQIREQENLPSSKNSDFTEEDFEIENMVNTTIEMREKFESTRIFKNLYNIETIVFTIAKMAIVIQHLFVTNLKNGNKKSFRKKNKIFSTEDQPGTSGHNKNVSHNSLMINSHKISGAQVYNRDNNTIEEPSPIDKKAFENNDRDDIRWGVRLNAGTNHLPQASRSHDSDKSSSEPTQNLEEMSIFGLTTMEKVSESSPLTWIEKVIQSTKNRPIQEVANDTVHESCSKISAFNNEDDILSTTEKDKNLDKSGENTYTEIHGSPISAACAYSSTPEKTKPTTPTEHSFALNKELYPNTVGTVCEARFVDMTGDQDEPNNKNGNRNRKRKKSMDNNIDMEFRKKSRCSSPKSVDSEMQDSDTTGTPDSHLSSSTPNSSINPNNSFDRPLSSIGTTHEIEQNSYIRQENSPIFSELSESPSYNLNPQISIDQEQETLEIEILSYTQKSSTDSQNFSSPLRELLDMPVLTAEKNLQNFLSPRLQKHMEHEKRSDLQFRPLLDGQATFNSLGQQRMSSWNSELVGSTIMLPPLHNGPSQNTTNLECPSGLGPSSSICSPQIFQFQPPPPYNSNAIQQPSMYKQMYPRFASYGMYNQYPGAKQLNLPYALAHNECRPMPNQATQMPFCSPLNYMVPYFMPITAQTNQSLPQMNFALPPMQLNSLSQQQQVMTNNFAQQPFIRPILSPNYMVQSGSNAQPNVLHPIARKELNQQISPMPVNVPEISVPKDFIAQHQNTSTIQSQVNPIDDYSSYRVPPHMLLKPTTSQLDYHCISPKNITIQKKRLTPSNFDTAQSSTSQIQVTSSGIVAQNRKENISVFDNQVQNQTIFDGLLVKSSGLFATGKRIYPIKRLIHMATLPNADLGIAVPLINKFDPICDSGKEQLHRVFMGHVKTYRDEYNTRPNVHHLILADSLLFAFNHLKLDNTRMIRIEVQTVSRWFFRSRSNSQRSHSLFSYFHFNKKINPHFFYMLGMDYLLYYQIDFGQVVSYVKNDLYYITKKVETWKKLRKNQFSLKLVFVTIPEYGEFKQIFEWYNRQMREALSLNIYSSWELLDWAQQCKAAEQFHQSDETLNISLLDHRFRILANLMSRFYHVTFDFS